MLKKALLAGVAILVFSLVLNWLVGLVFPDVALVYQNPALFRPWNDPIMMLYFGYPFVLGFALVYLWELVKNTLKGDPTRKALQFAKMYFIAAGIPGMFITYSSFQLPLAMVLLWLVSGFVEALIAGYVFARVKS